jgi:hypothetical protein
MNQQVRKYNLIEKLILLQDEKTLEKLESFLSSFWQGNNKTEKSKKFLSDYKRHILSVSVWTEKDIQLLKNNLKKINTWKIKKW